jgi:hypothetical protein
LRPEVGSGDLLGGAFEFYFLFRRVKDNSARQMPVRGAARIRVPILRAS